MSTIYINAFSTCSRLGMNRDETLKSLKSALPPRPDKDAQLAGGATTKVAALATDLPNDQSGETRTNQITAYLISQMQEEIAQTLAKYGSERVAGIIGTSTTGVEEAINPLDDRIKNGEWDDDYDFTNQELGDTAQFLKNSIGFTGPCHTVSTACTSGSKALAAAARFINAGLADAVICGGVDSLSRLTTNGFSALDSVSSQMCAPFSKNRCGINIGEGGALFIVSKDVGPWKLSGWGESSDAYHMSSPEPSGAGAELALNEAMSRANLKPENINFVHMHGTSTPLNDAMESTLVNRVFGPNMPCASTKGMTGHTLGAAGALQAAINIIALDEQIYPPHIYDGQWDDDLAPINLTSVQSQPDQPITATLSASYAFGGSNIALIIEKA
ncbi:beta-ketoacyl-ACP synthase [Hirschia baltica]|uniref:Beta-ketoacyl synthase n=1 Tax=Hirschia baltica (strain ATCC 49814 / DSM 5838 / IFAM 1418) TaxID=582402 RepID=C6XIP6_HIRBI|nr:beta-ketoacyl-ACP synthase [Hirschia baltica]ACT58991.1 Beta-ketoacyl synthase [Hirschia baltica ATCC 49814]